MQNLDDPQILSQGLSPNARAHTPREPNYPTTPKLSPARLARASAQPLSEFTLTPAAMPSSPPESPNKVHFNQRASEISIDALDKRIRTPSLSPTRLGSPSKGVLKSPKLPVKEIPWPTESTTTTAGETNLLSVVNSVVSDLGPTSLTNDSPNLAYLTHTPYTTNRIHRRRPALSSLSAPDAASIAALTEPSPPPVNCFSDLLTILRKPLHDSTSESLGQSPYLPPELRPALGLPSTSTPQQTAPLNLPERTREPTKPAEPALSSSNFRQKFSLKFFSRRNPQTLLHNSTTSTATPPARSARPEPGSRPRGLLSKGERLSKWGVPRREPLWVWPRKNPTLPDQGLASSFSLMNLQEATLKQQNLPIPFTHSLDFLNYEQLSPTEIDPLSHSPFLKEPPGPELEPAAAIYLTPPTPSHNLQPPKFPNLHTPGPTPPSTPKMAKNPPSPASKRYNPEVTNNNK